MSFDHPNHRAALAMTYPANLVHERIHKQYAPAIGLEQVLWIGWVRYLVDRKAAPMITYCDLKSLGRVFESHFHFLRFIKLIAMFYGIGYGFAYGQVYGENEFIAKTAATGK